MTFTLRLDESNQKSQVLCLQFMGCHPSQDFSSQSSLPFESNWHRDVAYRKLHRLYRSTCPRALCIDLLLVWARTGAGIEQTSSLASGIAIPSWRNIRQDNDYAQWTKPSRERLG